MKWRTGRKIIQLAALGLLFLPVLWSGHQIWLGSYISSQIFEIALTDPLTAAEVMAAGKIIWMPLLWSIFPLIIVAIILGRVFCSWVCPLHTLFELAALLKTPQKSGATNNFQPYWLLGGLMPIAAISGLPLFTIVSPIGIFMRGLVFGTGPELALVGGLLAGEWMVDNKFWCRYWCPAGALYGLLGRWRGLKIGVHTPKCNSCGSCRKSCSMNVNPGSNQLSDTLFCTNCGDCIDVCTVKAVGYTWNWKGGQK